MTRNNRSPLLVLIGVLAALSLVVSLVALRQGVLPRRIVESRQFRLSDQFDRERARLSFTPSGEVLLQIFDTSYNNTITVTFDAETGTVYLTDAAGSRRPLDLPPPQGSP